MKAYRYLDETLGAKYEVEEIPADLRTRRSTHRDADDREGGGGRLTRRATTILFEKYVAGETPTRGRDQGRPSARPPSR